jgi:hypothetical protein
MLTPRGEHLYFIGNTSVTLILMNPHMAPARSRELSWSERVASLRYGPLLGMVWKTSPPLLVSTVFLRLTRALIPAAVPLALETHPGRRGGADFARNRQSSRHLETGCARTGRRRRPFGRRVAAAGHRGPAYAGSATAHSRRAHSDASGRIPLNWKMTRENDRP